MFKIVRRTDWTIVHILGIRIKISKNYSFEKILYNLAFFVPKKYKSKWWENLKYNKFSFDEVAGLIAVYKAYPKNILSAEDSINYVVKHKCSVARIGDGEELVGNMLAKDPVFEGLKKRLIEICESGTDDTCLVCFNQFNIDDDKLLKGARQHFAWYYSRRLEAKDLENISFVTDRPYGNAYLFLHYFRATDSKEERKQKRDNISAIWADKKILFVVNEASKICQDDWYFDNTLERAFVNVPPSKAYGEYDRIMSDILKYDKDWLIYIEAGACATVLAYDLSKLGYQALDMGDYYSRIIYKQY